MLMSTTYRLFLIAVTATIICFQSCVPNNKSVETNIQISYSDPEIQKIADLQDKQDMAGLYAYFNHENPTYRYLAVTAFSSIKNSLSGDSLMRMLQDPVMQVRAAAAYALGQNGSSTVTDRLIASFRGKDTLDINNLYNANILEAVGKTGALPDLKALSTVKTYRATDTLLLQGQTKAIYRMALRGVTTEEGTARMVEVVSNTSIAQEARLYAANYLARVKNISLGRYYSQLQDLLKKDQDPNIRMAIATSMGNNKDSLFLQPLKSAIHNERDFRVKCNIIRSLGNYPYFDIRDVLLPELKNDNIHIASLAADVFQKNGFVEDVPLYASYDTMPLPWQVKAPMNGAVLAHTALYYTVSKNAFSERILKNLKEADSPYAKAAYARALSKDPFNYALINQQFKQEKSTIVKIAFLEGLGDILKNPQFFKAFGNNYGRVKAEILSILVEAVNSGDVGQMATAAEILKTPKMAWKEWLKDLSFLKEAQSALKLPQDIETYNILGECIALLSDTKYEPKRAEYNHPINWNLLSTVTDSSIAAVKTTQGVIRIQLLKNTAPGSVANFVELMNNKYYNGKVFHRVVPNFVIQTGCSRGDGYGSEPFTIRSELPQIYYNKEGYVGMASAGNHTESTQWFITMSPTPHLDGNYTIFGKVVEGMDVVYKIQQGDKINEIIFIK